jgi:hypothetical protein
MEERKLPVSYIAETLFLPHKVTHSRCLQIQQFRSPFAFILFGILTFNTAYLHTFHTTCLPWLIIISPLLQFQDQALVIL